MRPEYTEEHVRQLLSNYVALAEAVDTTPAGLRLLVQKADLDRAMARLPYEFAEVVAYHGLAGLPQDEAAEVLQKSQQWVSKRFRFAVEELTYLINGGD